MSSSLALPPSLLRLGSNSTQPCARESSSTNIGIKKIRLIENQNDILLAEEDLSWIRATFTKDELTVFETGGHLGNLAHPAVQKAILEALENLNPIRPKRGIGSAKEGKASFPSLVCE